MGGCPIPQTTDSRRGTAVPCPYGYGMGWLALPAASSRAYHMIKTMPATRMLIMSPGTESSGSIPRTTGRRRGTAVPCPYAYGMGWLALLAASSRSYHMIMTMPATKMLIMSPGTQSRRPPSCWSVSREISKGWCTSW